MEKLANKDYSQNECNALKFEPVELKNKHKHQSVHLSMKIIDYFFDRLVVIQ